MDNTVATRIQNVLLTNRVKILKLCDYFTVSAPLISKRYLPLDKHKEIKSVAVNMTDAKSANTARMDALLDFVDEFPNIAVFDTFLEGIKNCESSKQFAKILKKEVEGGNGGIKLPPKFKSPKPKTSFGKSRPLIPNSAPFLSTSPVGIGIGNGPLSLPAGFNFGNSATFYAGNLLPPTVTEIARGGPPILCSAPPSITTKKLSKKTKIKIENGPMVIAPAMDVFAFNPNANPIIPPLPSKPRSARPKKSVSKAPVVADNVSSLLNNSTVTTTATGARAQTPSLKTKRPPIKKVYPSKVKPKIPSKIVTPGPSLTATVVYKKPEAVASTSAAASTTPKAAAVSTPKQSSESTTGFTTKVPAGSPFRPKNGLAKSQQNTKPMTFLEADERQRKNTIRAGGFAFINSVALVKKINFNNKSDLFYEGCPTKQGNYLCTKKVQLKGKGKKYVCKEKHENEAYELFPRLYMTFEDPTTHMEATIYRENVEILAGKSVSEMHSMNDTELSTEFAKAIGQNIPIRITSEKILKKDLKHSGGKTWSNVAHILNDSGSQSSGPPPSKKAKKTQPE